MRPLKVLMVVEDDDDMLELIAVTLRAEPRLEISGQAARASDAIEAVGSEEVDLIILDHFIDGEVMGLQAAPTLKGLAPAAKILLFSSHDLAVEALREPAVDAFLMKKDLRRLLPTCRRLLGLEDPAAHPTGE